VNCLVPNAPPDWKIEYVSVQLSRLPNPMPLIENRYESGTEDPEKLSVCKMPLVEYVNVWLLPLKLKFVSAYDPLEGPKNFSP